MLIALKERTIAGQVYKPGQHIPAEVWRHVPERNRRAMLSLRLVRQTDDVSLVSSPPPPAAKTFACAECDKVFPTMQALGGHRRRHQAVQPRRGAAKES